MTTQYEERAEMIVNPTLEVGVGLRTRTTEQGARQAILMLKEQPELCRALLEIGDGGYGPERLREIPEPLFRMLKDYGVLIRRQELPDEILFDCMIDELPLELIPYRNRNGRLDGASPRELVVNPRARLQTGTDLPDELLERAPHRDKFQQGNAIVWVEDPGTEILAPYWLKPQWVEPLGRLLRGQLQPSSLDARSLEALAHAKILIPRDHQETRRRAWEREAARLSAELEAKQYVVLRGILEPLQIAAFRRHFRLLDERGHLRLQPERKRYVMHNEGVARFIHHQTTRLINRTTPEPVKPSYSFLCTYKAGGFIPRHTDRAQCAWNLSLLIDTEPEADLSDAWPIYLEADGRVEEARLEMGDGVLYRGTDIPHWREPLPEGKQATLIFCHYVPPNFREGLN